MFCQLTFKMLLSLTDHALAQSCGLANKGAGTQIPVKALEMA